MTTKKSDFLEKSDFSNFGGPKNDNQEIHSDFGDKSDFGVSGYFCYPALEFFQIFQ